MTAAARLGRRVAVAACALYALAAGATAGWVAASAEYAARSAEAAAVARWIAWAARRAARPPTDPELAALALHGAARLAHSDRIVVVGDTARVRARVPMLAARELRRLATEDRPLVLGRGPARLVTVPIKDADQWDIVGAVGAVARPWRAAAPLLAAVLLGAMLAAVAAVEACRRLARRSARSGRILAAAGAALIPVSAGTLVLMERSALAATAQIVAPQGAEGLAAAHSLPLPSLGGAALLHAAAAVLGAAGVLAGAWLVAPRRPAEVRDTLAAWGFLAPSLAHLLVFSVGPLAFALYISFFQWDLLRATKPFVGLANYREMARDPLFWNALRNTAIYSLYVPLTMVLALGAATVVNQRLRGIRLVRAAAFLPYVASYVAIAIVWQWMFNYDYGILNWALRRVGLAGVDWLGDPRTALPAVMLVSAWVQLGYQMVIYLAGLQGIPESLHEAARLDGASAWQRFRHVTLPLLRPVHVYVFVTGVIWSFHAFTLVYVMTEGGPVHSTDVVVYQIYQNAWEFRRMGYAAAMSWMLFLLLLALTLVQWRVLERRVDYA